MVFWYISIVKHKSQVAYEIKLDTSKVNPIFHASLLKPHKEDPIEDLQPLRSNSVYNNLIIQPAAIIGHITKTEGTELQPQVLVQWTGLPVEELPGRI